MRSERKRTWPLSLLTSRFSPPTPSSSARLGSNHAPRSPEAPPSPGLLRHPQSAARDRHRRHLRLSAQSARRLSHRSRRSRRRGGVDARRARAAAAFVQRPSGHGAVVAGLERRSACPAGRRRPRDRPGRLRHQGRGRRPARRRGGHPRRRRVLVQHRRRGQRPALHRRLPRHRSRFRRSHHRRADDVRSGARAPRHQLGAAEVLRRRRSRLGRERDADQRVAPGDPLGRQGAGLRRVAIAPALRRPDRPALQHRPGRRRDQGQHDRAERRAALRFPAAALAVHRRAARRFPRHGRRQRDRKLRRNFPRPLAAGRRRRHRRATAPGRARSRRRARPADRQRGRLLDRSFAVLGRRPDRYGLRPRRHRPGPHRRRVGRPGTAATLRRQRRPHHGQQRQ